MTWTRILLSNALEARGMAPLIGDAKCTKTCPGNNHRVAYIDGQVRIEILLPPHLAIVERQYDQSILGSQAKSIDATADLLQFLPFRLAAGTRLRRGSACAKHILGGRRGRSAAAGLDERYCPVIAGQALRLPRQGNAGLQRFW